MEQASDIHVAIVGAGIAGLSLAIVLESRSVPCTIFEKAPVRNKPSMGSMQLGPNALAVLDRLGVYDNLLATGHSIQSIGVKNDDGKETGRMILGSKPLCGYDALRIKRQTLIDELKVLAETRGIEIRYGKRLMSVLHESWDSGVRFAFADGTQEAATVLAAAEGFHSRVRSLLFPDVKPTFTGSLGIGASTPAQAAYEHEDRTDDVDGIYIGKSGAFIIVRENREGTDLLTFKQQPSEDRSRAGWSALSANKAEVRALLNADKEYWPRQVSGMIDRMRDDEIWIWPMYTLPPLLRWTSATGQIVLIGDAAHAMPPAAGQGGNMALEDAYTLGISLPLVSDQSRIESALAFWQQIRQNRVQNARDLTRRMMNARLQAARRETVASGDVFDFHESQSESSTD